MKRIIHYFERFAWEIHQKYLLLIIFCVGVMFFHFSDFPFFCIHHFVKMWKNQKSEKTNGLHQIFIEID